MVNLMPLKSKIIKYFNIKYNMNNRLYLKSYINNEASIICRINNKILILICLKLREKILKEMNVIK